MVSSLRRLPSEILSEIFLHCSRSQDGCTPRPFAAVCSRWRDVALLTPRLWCNVYLYETEIATPSLHSLLSLQLERSGQVPLDVVFSDPYDKTSIFELVLTASHRWQSLDLDLTFSQHEHLCSSASHFPILKRLTIRIVPSLELGNLSKPLPLLEELTLKWPPYLVPPELPWTRLTKCTLIHCSSFEVLNILRSSSAMEELSLYQCYGPDQRDPKPIPTTSKIRYLKMSRCDRAFNKDFLAYLTAPVLQELLIEHPDESGTTTQITSLLAAPITRLTLCGVRVLERDLIALLKLADAVDHLEISWPGDVHSNDLMEALTIGRGKHRPRLLPGLRVLNITGGLSCGDHQLLMMLQSRCPGLERVELFYAGRTFFFDRSFDGLRQAGMEISVRLDGPLDPFST
ncbi:hypothetical protein DFH09DRAFT_659085 [Mycena vulgaris]|nr:hypothetical protein DFH09DRAFT_659085 [Mycena vulgaris]